MRARGGLPEVWVSNLRDLCAGEAQCAFRPWFLARNWVKTKPDPTFDKAGWTANHNRLVALRAEQLRRMGYTVTIERQNDVRLDGHAAAMVGRPDIVGLVWPPNQEMAADAIVSDAKTGQQKNADWWQVLIYVFVLPMIWARKGIRLANVSGEVVYGDPDDAGAIKVVPVKADDLTPENQKTIVDNMLLLGGPMPPEAVASGSECAKCPLTRKECPSRVEPIVGTTTLW